MFISFPIGGHLGCFYFLTIMTKVIEDSYSWLLLTYIILGGVGLMGHSTELCLTFLETAKQFSKLVPNGN